MAKRVKISDLPVVEDKEAPVLCHLSYPSQDDPALLHISNRTGIIPTTHKYGVTSIYHITRCNRPLEHPHFYQESEFPELDYLPEYRLCPRCGSRDEFKEALVKRNEWVVQRERQLEKEQEEKREAAELERVRRQMAITDFLNAHSIPATYPVVEWDGAAAVVRYGKDRFRVSLEEKK